MFNTKDLQKILTSQNVLSSEEFAAHKKAAKKDNKEVEEYLLDKKILTSANLYNAVADYYKLPFISLKDKNIRKDILTVIPEPIAQTHQVITFDKDNKTLSVATLDPKDLEIFEFLRKKTNLEIAISITTPEDMREALKLYHKGLEAEFAEITSGDKKDDQREDVAGKELEELAQDLPVIRIVDTLLEYAIFEGASDIHIEVSEKEVSVRYRIDGILHTVMTLPKSVHPGVVARIKILSNLKLDEHRVPQDGRFKISTNEYKVSFRVSITPTYDGEKVVLRLLNEKNQLLTLDELGFQKKALDIVKRNITKPNGMLLVTGPTGSGKTTTLYTILNMLNKPEVNICTIEDPIEYRMPHINQSQVNNKINFTFAAGLRSFLRQDPDIIMVGEIRDQETAEIAVHAAMTGHLVLSTLHTNDAVTTMPRLADMNIPNFLLASTTNIVVAQRLVRKICRDCIESYTLTQKEIDTLEKQVAFSNLVKMLAQEGVVDSGKQKTQNLRFYRGKGCKKCNDTGYKGRLGIFEILEITGKVEEAITQKVTPEKLFELAREQKMMTMLEDGFIKAKNGITTIEEVLRVTKE
ncbi:MAG: hypothetical protein COT81_00365 [Candidatus Buchananbacteria bacterium CG10_big_fil_rev_8_21_14_0_10_42_9]|uniref:Bacterial type II secretion system protein E domain-containing protein n=1 Tax=Candidatus Buchananbacteria bacterium CG10_big_fil_rev_8_21_14_0_10_42_9 TaxID=1974526 RepID=A0A2H0W2K5_9BACT|nr:MAG: hypothetical protein COT81_00365 [Candidatus Buchananbacteria bacterium CG10_big_fil_rev_8_21_14_0_10_42_9]